MLRGKSWSVEEEKQLRELIGGGFGLALVDAGTVPLPLASSSASSSTPSQTASQPLDNGPSVSSSAT